MRRIRSSNPPASRGGLFVLKSLTLAAFTGVPLASWAFGVGEAQLLSSYAQPLLLRVPVTLAREDEVLQASEVAVRLLPYSAYESMGVSTPPVSPENIQLDVSGSGKTYWVRMTSRELVREPFMTLLLEVRVAGVRVVRELPILFDLPQQQAPAVAVAAVAQLEAQPSITAAADIPAPVAVEPPAPPPEPVRRAQRKRSAQSKKSATSVKPQDPAVADTGGMFKLAPWNHSGAAPKVLIRRFQLAQRLESFRQMQPAGAAPVAALEVQIPVAGASAAVAPPVARVADAVAAAPAPSKAAWLVWMLLGGAVYALGGWLLRRRTAAPRRRVAKKVAPVPEILPAQIAVSEVPPPVIVTPEPVTLPPAVALPVVAEESSRPAEIKKRLAELLARNPGDPNVLRKTQLVSAYLDLGRVDSAETLLRELEGESSGSGRPRIALIKG